MNFSALLKSIPLSRLQLYLLILGLLPLAMVAFFFFTRLETLENIQRSIEGVQFLALQKEKKQSVNKLVRARFADADHFYIDKHLESLSFLNSEVQNLEEISNHPNFTEDEGVRNRLEFLTGEQNRLHFAEGGLQSTPLFQEVVETAAHPVQIDATDLKKILSLVEGVPFDGIEPVAGRPQLMFLDFKLEKKGNGQNREVFLLNMKLLKREFQ